MVYFCHNLLINWKKIIIEFINWFIIIVTIMSNQSTINLDDKLATLVNARDILVSGGINIQAIDDEINEIEILKNCILRKLLNHFKTCVQELNLIL